MRPQSSKPGRLILPASPKPIFDARYGHLTPIAQALAFTQQKVSQQNAGANQGMVVDSNGNCTEVYGANLNQVVTIGSTATTGGPTGKPGVLITTGIAQGVAGRAVVYSGSSGAPRTIPTGKIDLTAGSTAATLESPVYTGTFLSGLLIGAANVTDPSSGLATPAITPGTTISSISGTGPWSIVLSAPAVESGHVYCAAATFQLIT